MSQLVPLPLVIQPGIIVTDSLRASEGRWVLPMDKIRFVNSRPQKIGGNVRVSSTAMSGTPRASHAWRDFSQNQYLASGTYRKLYIFDSSWSLNDITPFSSTGTLTTGGVIGLGSVTHGSGYTVGTFNGVALTGGTGSGITANLVLSGGGVTSATVVNAGVGYTVGDVLTCANGLIGGSGSGWSVPVATIAPFTTTSGLTSVNVQHKNHGRNVGDTAIFSGASSFNNVNPNGTFVVQTVVDTNNYTITATTTANATGSGGGNATAYSYEISVGTELGAYGQGWGVGQWGLGTWGTARGSSVIFFEPRVWSLDHFGAVLLAAYNGGTLWAFDPTQSQPWPRAVGTFNSVAMNAPTDFRAMFITPERFVFGLCDKMVVKACSQGDPTTWTPATANTAFQRTLQIGTKLVGGRVLAPFISMVWSDAAAYLFQYTGSQFVYNSSVAGLDCGLISPGAVVTVDGFAYWQGPDNYYLYNGSVQPMANVEDIRKYVFDAIPANLQFQCHAVYIPKYHEIRFFYPTTGDTNPTHYVAYHINDQCWSVGTDTRASGTHFTQGDTSPLMAGNDGFIYNHDFVGDTYNDNGAALTWTLTLAPYALSEGLQNLDIEGILFDFFQQAGNISATVNTYDRLTDSSTMDTETETIPAANAGLTDMRVSGRYIGLSMTSSDLGNYMRLGKPVAFARPSAKRR